MCRINPLESIVLPPPGHGRDAGRVYGQTRPRRAYPCTQSDLLYSNHRKQAGSTSRLTDDSNVNFPTIPLFPLRMCTIRGYIYDMFKMQNPGPDPNAGAQTALRLLVRLGNAYRRLLAMMLGIIGPRNAYALLAFLARLMYRLLDPLRERCQAQCQAALGNRYSPRRIKQIAEKAFVHRAWNLVDLMLAERFVRRSTYRNHGGSVPEPYRTLLHDLRRRGQPLILLTAYYGAFDLLPLFLGYEGIRAGVVYRRHANASFDNFRRSIRSRSGCEMIPDTQAVSRVPRILDEGGTVAILADHHAERRGIPVDFLGLPTVASRSIGLLAQHYNAAVVVAGIRRADQPFQFQIEVRDSFDAEDWGSTEDPVRYITERYLGALEKLILADPTQYLWAHARWGEDLARRLTSED